MRPVSILFLLVALTSCATSPHPTLERFEFTRVEMGMPFTIVLHAANTNQAERAATAAFDRVRALNAIFSDYEDDSELTQLSRSSGKNQSVPLSPELWDILERAQDLAERTQGAFDVTVGPYVSLWRRARRQREMPRPDLMQIARERVGYAHLHLDPVHRTALLAVPRMRLDLGGIAKGYALDEALRVLDRHGFPRALVSGGGDIVAGDPPPGHQGWRIALTPLDDPENRPAEQLLVSRRAVATSGDLFQYVEIEGRRYSHIVDPRTGLGLTQRRLVTVIATDSTTADSLATSLSVLGPEAGLNLAAQFPGVEARILQLVHGEIQTHATRGFSRWIAPPD
jgi:FAD:protein FMN transferase